MRKQLKSIATCATMVMISAAAVRAITFDDIQYWVGEGSNQAAFVVSWNDGLDPAVLAWGYRWDGEATGEDMLFAVSQTDRSLELEYTDWGWGRSVDGFYYDLNKDGDAREQGVDHTENSGWWQYFTSTNGSTWQESSQGMSDRVLSDGDWDGWQRPWGSDPANLTPAVPAAPIVLNMAAPEPWSQFRGNAGHLDIWPGSIDPHAVTSLWAASHNLSRATQPVVSPDGQMVFAYGNRAADEGAVVAFDAATGAVAWSNSVRSYTDWDSWSSPVYHEGYIYWAGGTSPFTLYKMRAADGSTSAADGGWVTNYPGDILNATPTLAGNHLYISTYGGMAPENARHYAVNIMDGTIVWSNQHGGQGQGAAAYDADRDLVYQTVYTNATHVLRAYHAASGTIAWTAPWQIENPPSQAAIAYRNDSIYFQDYDFSGDGNLYRANAADHGAKISMAATPNSGSGVPAIDHIHRTYVSGDWSGSGRTRAYDARGGTRWTFDQGGGWTASPAWADGYVFIGDQSTTDLYLLHDHDGGLAMRVDGSGPPAFGRNTFYSIGHDGVLYAYRANTNNPERTHTITVTVSGNGDVGPLADRVQVAEGGTPSFAIAARPHHHVVDVLVNGISQGTPDVVRFAAVTNNQTLDVFFAINTYHLRYTAGDHGAIVGEASQIVEYDTHGTSVTAQPVDGYDFMEWSDGSTKNPRQDLQVSADLQVTARFAKGSVRRGFSLSNIEYWVGSGSNRAALVIDWHDGTRPHALAWGYRWDGQATGMDMWQAVSEADAGLTGIVTNIAGTDRLTWIEYRRPRRPGDLLPETGVQPMRWTAYTWDHEEDANGTNAWSYWTSDGMTNYAAGAFSPSSAGPFHRTLQDLSWDAWSRAPAGHTNPPGWIASALYDPFATEVRAYSFGDGDPPIDFISGEPFTNAAMTLGRPTVDTTGDGWDIPLDENVPLVPVNAAFRAHELVSIGENGYLELAFENKVFDNPDNPYGMDFIVFGNSFQTIGGGDAWKNRDPNETLAGSSCNADRGIVSVSQDGQTWHVFTNGPYADDFAPTLGRVYDPDHVHTNLGAWNKWWSGPTDPTVPVDPSLIPADWNGISVAELARRYRGSAGGTAFDISRLPLDPCPDTGWKWIRYVRIERNGANNVEIDAVASVSPATPYDLWRNRYFTWLDDPAHETDGADPSGEGMANLMNYTLGRDPSVPVDDPVISLDLCTTGATRRVRIQTTIAAEAPDAHVDIVRANTLPATSWTMDPNRQSLRSETTTNGLVTVTFELDADTDAEFLRLRSRFDE